ncbi:MAG TPA: cache domain-containing protein, partial [Gallionella sp.]|nr:cache domain-containing protein [Gallionella sp.]
MPVKNIHITNQFRRSFLSLFLPLMLLVLLAAAYRFNQEVADQKSILKADGSLNVVSGGRAIERALGGSVRDVLYLATNRELTAERSATATGMETLRRDFVLFSLTHPTYYRLRWLDENGKEVLRVNNVDGQISITPPDKLENKRDRFYFKESLALEPGKIYVSPLHLEFENKEVVKPYLPIIRIATPIFDAHARRHGVLVATVTANEILSRIGSGNDVSRSQNMLLNSDGYWLRSPDSADEWGFMFERKETLASRNPAAWKAITAIPSGQV